MEQLLLHLFGDYVTQTDWMAKNKTSKRYVAFIHATVYAVPFMFLLDASGVATWVILVTHYFIDHYRLARFVVFAKNKVTDWKLQWEDCKDTGYHKDMPAWLSVWLLIITDNALHLAINYFALRYL